MTQRPPEAFSGSSPAEIARFIRQRQDDLSLLRRVIVESGRTRVLDVNRSELVFPGISYGHPWLETILKEAGASYDPATLGTPARTPDGTREFRVSAKYPWAHDRVD
ncbi:MAG: hypothetical protein JNL10_16410 [Verrucomicrobiales bacterium]|nr:hypothetical protein [Verrucomicrobiales bacterium]